MGHWLLMDQADAELRTASAVTVTLETLWVLERSGDPGSEQGAWIREAP